MAASSCSCLLLDVFAALCFQVSGHVSFFLISSPCRLILEAALLVAARRIAMA
jgi:hypothetical protein